MSLVRQGDYRDAVVCALVDAANLFEARAGAAMPKRYRCACCGYEAHAFRHMFSGGHAVWNSACPGCDSRSRHRGLAVLLPRLLEELQPRKVLHFAPEPVLAKCFSGRDLTYETADLYLDDATHPGVDVQDLPFGDRSYDFVLCNHVLEHVPDDHAALRELARVLRPSGVAVLTVPGDFSRMQTVRFEGELPNGHFRDYGRDFVDLLESVFARVRPIDMSELDLKTQSMSFAIRRGDLAFVCE